MKVLARILVLAFLFASPVMVSAATAPRFEPATCPKLQSVAWLANATCGYLVVPENRDGGVLIDWLRNQTYNVPTLQAAPNRIVGLAAGKRDSIEAIAKHRATRAPPYSPTAPVLGDGLAVDVTCREDYPFATPEELATSGREAFPDYPASVQHEGVGMGVR